MEDDERGGVGSQRSKKKNKQGNRRKKGDRNRTAHLTCFGQIKKITFNGVKVGGGGGGEVLGGRGGGGEVTKEVGWVTMEYLESHIRHGQRGNKRSERGLTTGV